MGIKLSHGIALTTSVLLIAGLTGCAGSSEHAEPSSVAPSTPEPEAPQAVSLSDAQHDIPWPDGMTLPIPEAMHFDGIENHFACDGELLSVLISSPDASEGTTRSYLEGVQDLFAIPDEVRQGAGQDSLRDRTTGELKADGQIQDKPSAMDATKIVGWESLDGEGYRFHLQEVAPPGIPVQVANTPPSAWADFPRPEASGFERCEAREESGYRDGTGFTPASMTWTLTAPITAQTQVSEWMKGLATNGWKLSDASESGPKPGAPNAKLKSADYTAQYLVGTGELTLVLSDRKLDKFLGY